MFLVHGENTVVVQYRLLSPAEATLEVRPLIAFRDYHSLTHSNDAIDRSVVLTDGCALVSPYRGLPPLYFAHNAQSAAPTGDWYLNHEYDRERDRGLDFQEDLFNPFSATFSLFETAAVVASTEYRSAAQAGALMESELRRRVQVVASAPSGRPFVQRLVAAADQFVVKRGDLQTIIAGYHWFSDWGRDTMIALPGIALVTGRYEVARKILLGICRVCR